MKIVQRSDSNFLELWDKLVNQSLTLNALSSNHNLAYYEEYYGVQPIRDFSCLILQGEIVICGIAAFLYIDELNGYQVSCHGEPIRYIENAEADACVIKAGTRVLMKYFKKQLLDLGEKSTIKYRDFLHQGNLSPLSRLLLNLGIKNNFQYSQVIDLSLSQEVLHSQLSKSYKWSINWGNRNLSLKTLDFSNIMPEDFAEFQLLHKSAAGRQTRSLKTWQLQFNMITSNEAFCVLAYSSNRLLSAAFFSHNHYHCYYGVSASDRNYFDKPLSHPVIWHGLLHAKNLGIRYFEMGEQHFPKVQGNNVSNKQLGIATFKRSVGGNTKVFVDFNALFNPALIG